METIEGENREQKQELGAALLAMNEEQRAELVERVIDRSADPIIEALTQAVVVQIADLSAAAAQQVAKLSWAARTGIEVCANEAFTVLTNVVDLAIESVAEEEWARGVPDGNDPAACAAG